MTIAVSDATFEKEVLQSEVPVLVDFWATWCGPCKAMAPALDEVAEEMAGSVKIVKLEVDASPGTPEKYGVRGMPTLILFKDGKPTVRHMGALVQKAKLAEWIGASLAKGDVVVAPPSVTEFKLSNGMNVVVVTDRSMSEVRTTIFHKVGLADAPEGGSAIPFLINNLTMKAAQAAGDRVGMFSTFEVTHVSQRTSKELLASSLARGAARMTDFTISDEVVAAERQLMQEQRSSRPSNATARLHAEMDGELLGSHPYRTSVHGSDRGIAELSATAVMQFYRRYQAANSAVLVIAGDVNPDEIKALVEDTFGKIPAGDAIERTRTTPPKHDAARRVTVAAAPADKASFARKYIVPSHITAEPGKAEALEVLARLLGSKSGPLHRELVVDEKLCEASGAEYSDQSVDFGTLLITTRGGSGNLARVEAAVDRIIGEMQASGPTASEVARAQESMLAAADPTQLPFRLGLAVATGRTVEQVLGWPEAIAKVTVEDVKHVASTYLDPRRSATGWLVPGTGESADDKAA